MDDLKNGNNKNIVLFSLDAPRYALYLSVVERVVSAVEITPLPKSPEIVLGVINYQGEIIPVVDIRKRFKLPSRDINIEDQFIIAKTSKRIVVIAVDSVNEIYELDQLQFVDAETAFPYTDFISGITKIEGNIILINDLEKFLSLEEEIILEKALAGESG